MVDGAAVYQVDGTVVSSGKEEAVPAAGAQVVVMRAERQFRPEFDIDERTPGNKGFAVADARGHFSFDMAGPRWGYTLLLGIIPTGDTKSPVPPVLDEVHVYVRTSRSSSWRIVEVPTPLVIQSDSGPGWRLVHLGTVSLGP
jgi:hypothetical protein